MHKQLLLVIQINHMPGFEYKYKKNVQAGDSVTSPRLDGSIRKKTFYTRSATEAENLSSVGI